jgi:hypothetical protein
MHWLVRALESSPLMLLAVAACTEPGESDTSMTSTGIVPGTAGEGMTTAGEATEGTVGTTAASGVTTADDTSGDDPPGTLFDQGLPPDGGGPPGGNPCMVSDEGNAVGKCGEVAPPDSFEPEVQWEWTGAAVPGGSFSPPLVANVTDDDGNGVVDLCDVPDVVLVAQSPGFDGGLYVLDGATGAEHWSIPNGLSTYIVPALGDIDGDGTVEILAGTNGAGFATDSQVIAYENDGTHKWTSPVLINHGQGFAIALADIDHDGDVEVIADDTVLDHQGNLVWTAPEPIGWTPYDIWHCTATAVADLDGDDEMEIILGQSAYRSDGTQYWLHANVEPGFPQVANLDADPQPEILVTNRAGLTLIQHDGTLTYTDARPTNDPYPGWFRPATVHDFDGDGQPEMAVSSASHYSVVETDLSILWTANVQDASGWSAGTAFDFLGDGTAEAMYTDEVNLFVFDETGNSIFTVPRTSPTLIEYPTVADVDNDGSAEILVSSYGTVPTLQVIRDVKDRWIQARRIWNQHTYHVTNVREDGTIPQFEANSWEQLNTYRTNAQIEGGSICNPEPAG